MLYNYSIIPGSISGYYYHETGTSISQSKINSRLNCLTKMKDTAVAANSGTGTSSSKATFITDEIELTNNFYLKLNCAIEGSAVSKKRFWNVLISIFFKLDDKIQCEQVMFNISFTYFTFLRVRSTLIH